MRAEVGQPIRSYAILVDLFEKLIGLEANYLKNLAALRIFSDLLEACNGISLLNVN